MELIKSKLCYGTVSHLMREFNRIKRSSGGSVDGVLHAVVVFTEDSFTDENLSLEARSYLISSDSKAYIDGMGGYSIYGSSLDGKDVCVRLEAYMKEERGGSDGWEVEYCYFV